MKRIFHPYNLWEDFTYGFYGGKEYNQKEAIKLCANLLKDLPRFETALKEIIDNWKYSCEHNLSNEAMNRIAYLGQAAHALVYNVPNSVSMGAYSTLTLEEQKAADALAQKYLDLWLSRHNKETDVTT